MLRLVAVLVVFTLTPPAAFAAAKWNGAGWYQTAEGEDGGDVVAGPFADQATCEATLPPDGDYYEYLCRYFEANPDWLD